MYDLSILPINQQNDSQVDTLPGLHAASAPRRAARSRVEDQLMIMFTGPTADHSDVSLEKLADSFFKTGGSVTAALRMLVETLNLTLLEKNLADPAGGGPGAVTIAAVHRRNLYLVQSGATHAFAINHQGLHHFYDASQADRGLGLSRSPTIRYFQVDLGTGAYFWVSDLEPGTWTEDRLIPGDFPRFDQLCRRLLNQATDDIRLALVGITPGDGRIRFKTQQPAEPEKTSTPRQPTPPEPTAPSSDLTVDKQEADAPIDETQQVLSYQKQPVTSQTADQNASAAPSAAVDKPETRQTVLPGKPGPIVDKALVDDGLTQVRDSSLKGLAWVYARWKKGRAALGQFFEGLYTRFAPNGVNGMPQLSRGSMLLIAVAVPLVVVLISMSVYLIRGRTIQYQYYYDQALAASSSALAAQNPAEARSEWAQSLAYLDQAASFRRTDQLNELRIKAETELDRLDGAIRLIYRPALTTALNPAVEITRIISLGLDLYLLDNAGGQVIHATRTSQGYEIDTGFLCSPGNYAGGRIDAFVDMVQIPIQNPYQAHILVVDAEGSVAFCGPGQDPVVQTLPTPEGGAGVIERIAYEHPFLYTLNPQANAVHIYRSTNSQFLDSPSSFFAAENITGRPNLANVVDLAVNGTDLYLLQRDGMIVACNATGLPGNPVVCENPVEYVDGRPGLEETPVMMPDSRYTAMLYTPPPDPSVTVLDGTEADLYRFSVRFRLHQRLRAELGDYEIDEPVATGFTIGIDRISFLAFGHQVFFAIVD